MAGFLGQAAIWIKAAHIVAVMAWMAGMLYLPRLFAYHAAAAPGSATSETFKVMERRLSAIIVDPALAASLLLGALLAADRGAPLWLEGWWHVKLVAVAAMIAARIAFGCWRRAFADDRNRHSARFYRIVGELPAVLVVVIVALAVVRPF